MTEECRSQFGVLFNNVGIISNTRESERKSCGDRGASVIAWVLFLIPVWLRGIVFNLVCSPIMRVLILIPVMRGTCLAEVGEHQ